MPLQCQPLVEETKTSVFEHTEFWRSECAEFVCNTLVDTVVVGILVLDTQVDTQVDTPVVNTLVGDTLIDSLHGELEELEWLALLLKAANGLKA